MTKREPSPADLAEFAAEFRKTVDHLANTLAIIEQMRTLPAFPAELDAEAADLIARVTYMRGLALMMTDDSPATWEARRQMFLDGLALLKEGEAETKH